MKYKSINREIESSLHKEVITVAPSPSSSPLLPRQGWQDREAYIKKIMETKAALEVIELQVLTPHLYHF